MGVSALVSNRKATICTPLHPDLDIAAHAIDKFLWNHLRIQSDRGLLCVQAKGLEHRLDSGLQTIYWVLLAYIGRFQLLLIEAKLLDETLQLRSARDLLFECIQPLLHAIGDGRAHVRC